MPSSSAGSGSSRIRSCRFGAFTPSEKVTDWGMKIEMNTAVNSISKRKVQDTGNEKTDGGRSKDGSGC